MKSSALNKVHLFIYKTSFCQCLVMTNPPCESSLTNPYIHCEQRNKEYVGETSSLLKSRVMEHLSRNSSDVHEHCRLTGHSVDSSKTNVLATKRNTLKRRIREVIEIRLHQVLFEQRQCLRISQHLWHNFSPLKTITPEHHLAVLNIHIFIVAEV